MARVRPVARAALLPQRGFPVRRSGPGHGQGCCLVGCLPGMRVSVAAGSRPLCVEAAGYGVRRLRGHDLPAGPAVVPPARGVGEQDVRCAGQRANQQARAPYPERDRRCRCRCRCQRRRRGGRPGRRPQSAPDRRHALPVPQHRPPASPAPRNFSSATGPELNPRHPGQVPGLPARTLDLRLHQRSAARAGTQRPIGSRGHVRRYLACFRGNTAATAPVPPPSAVTAVTSGILTSPSRCPGTGGPAWRRSSPHPRNWPPSPAGSAVPGAPALRKVTSTASRCSTDRCTGA
jgi:hypothetical protein